jgi:hypothetical protein
MRARGRNSGAATGVNYSGLIGVLVEAVKEQQEELDSMRALKAAVQQMAAIAKQQEAISQQREAISHLQAEITRLRGRDMIAQR